MNRSSIKSNVRVYLMMTLMLTVFASYAQNTGGNVSKSLDISGLYDSTKPVVQVVYDANLTSVMSVTTDVAIVVSDDSGISRVLIGEKEYDVDSEILFETVLKLPNNYNLSVTAFDVYDNQTTYETQILLNTVAPTPAVANTSPGAKERKYYALIMGVNEYADPNIGSLDEPINDGAKLINVLTSDYTFEKENITFLKNPTNEAIYVAFDKLSSLVTPDDFLLIFYAGHGYYDEKKNIGYWLPSDAKEKNSARWFRNSTLVENLGTINSRHTLLIADACFSGGIFKTRSAFNNADANIADMMKLPSRKAMTSGSLTTVPDKSVFMHYLLKILDDNEDKYLPSEDLFYDLAMRMKNNSDTRPLYGEIKNVGDEGGNFVFIRND